MNVEFEEINNKLYVRLSGELDHHSLLNERCRIEIKLSTNLHNEIVFDLNNLSFMDSSGISLIYGAYKIADEFGQNVTVLSENERFTRILVLAGMKKFVKIVSGREGE